MPRNANDKWMRTFGKWEQAFRAAATLDRSAILRNHLKLLDFGRWGARVPPSKQLLEGTVQTVLAIVAYYLMDGRSAELDDFLEMQQYDPSDTPGANYAFTFDLWGKAVGRVLVESKVGTIDLADLYGFAWPTFKTVGYGHMWISRTDCQDLTTDEFQQLECEVLDDLRYDYSENELDVFFDNELNEKYLFVTVQDRIEEDDMEAES